MSLWGWAVSGWLYRAHERRQAVRDATRYLERRQRAQEDRAIAAYERDHRDCLDRHGDACEGDCAD